MDFEFGLGAFFFGAVLFALEAGVIAWLGKGLFYRGQSAGLFAGGLFLKFFLLAGGLFLGLIGLDLDPVSLVAGAFVALAVITAAAMFKAGWNSRKRDKKIPIP